MNSMKVNTKETKVMVIGQDMKETIRVRQYKYLRLNMTADGKQELEISTNRQNHKIGLPNTEKKNQKTRNIKRNYTKNLSSIMLNLF